MHVTKVIPDPLICPLCGKGNACLNLGEKDVAKSCWCNDPNIQFPASLLNKVPPELQGKACICRECAVKYKQTGEL